jgi:NADH-quinone oxidoreductase subunit L
MNKELAALSILIILFSGAALVPLINLFSRKLVPIFSGAIGLIAAIVAFFLPFGDNNSAVKITYEWLPGVLKTGFLLDPLSMTPALIAAWIGFLVLVYSQGYMKHEENLGRYYSLVLLFIGAMVGMALADNFLTLFFFWEVMGVCSYLLIGFFYRDPKAANAGVKAFITTKIGDIGLLSSILILFAQSGTFAIADNLNFAAKISFPILSLISFGFIFGAVGKSAQVPLHVWLPDAMEAPTTISALIHAATMVNAGVYLVARVYPLLSQVPAAMVTIQWIGVLTAFIGSFLATFNYDLKRILAYSTVSQLGYMIFAVGVGGVFASQFHLFSHAIFKALLFLCAGSVIHELGTRDIREMGGLKKYMPITSTTFMIGALALMGMPILNGFFSKDLILEQALEHGSYAPLTVAVLAAMLTAFYSIRTTVKVFWGKPRTDKHVVEAPASMTIPLTILAVGSFISWLFIGNISEAWKMSQLAEVALDWKELLVETFTSHAFILTAIALIGGYLLFRSSSSIGSFLSEKTPGIFKATAIGLGFDIVYNKIISFIFGLGKIIRNFWDEKVMEGINKLVAGTSLKLSSFACKIQTGDVHKNLIYIVLALIIIIGTLIW